MTSRRNLILNIIYDFLAFICIHTVFAIILVINFGLSLILFSYLLIIPFYFYFFLRLKIKNITLFVILSLLPFSLLFFMPDWTSGVIGLFFIAVVLMHSMAVKLNRRAVESNIQIVIMPLVIIFFGAALNQLFNFNIPDVFFLTNSTLAIISYVLVIHISNIDGSLALLSSIGSQPVKPIMKFNNRVITLFVFLIALLAVLTRIIRLDLAFSFIWSYISYALLLFFRWLFSLINSNQIPPEAEPEPSPAMDAFQFLAEKNEPNIIFVILGEILVYLSYLLTIALVVFVIASAIYRFYKKFYEANHDDIGIKEFAAPLYQEIKLKNFFIKTMDLFPLLDKRMRIRRLFYKKVKSYINKGVKVENDNTVHILTKKISKFENIDDLAGLYEKARYSNDIHQ